MWSEGASVGATCTAVVFCCCFAPVTQLGNNMKRRSQECEDGEIGATPSTPPADQLHATPPEITPVHKKKKRKKMEAQESIDVINQVYGPKVCMRCRVTAHNHQQARATVQLREKQIRLQDVQSLLLWVLGDGSNPRWAFVQARGRTVAVTRVFFTNTTEQATAPYGGAAHGPWPRLEHAAAARGHHGVPLQPPGTHGRVHQRQRWCPARYAHFCARPLNVMCLYHNRPLHQAW